MLQIRFFNLATRTMAAQRNWEYRRLTATIIVGYREQHEVTYDLNHWESVERVYVDGALVIEKPMRVHLRRIKTMEFVVGHEEQHRVKIEFEMNTALSDAGQKHVRFYVDDQLISTTTA